MPMQDLGSKSDFAPEGEEPQIVYPSLFLSPEQTKALGLGSVNVGQELVMEAVVRVTSVNERETEDESGIEGKIRDVNLDIRQADMTPSQSSDQDRAERIFGRA